MSNHDHENVPAMLVIAFIALIGVAVVGAAFYSDDAKEASKWHYASRSSLYISKLEGELHYAHLSQERGSGKNAYSKQYLNLVIKDDTGTTHTRKFPTSHLDFLFREIKEAEGKRVTLQTLTEYPDELWGLDMGVKTICRDKSH